MNEDTFTSVGRVVGCGGIVVGFLITAVGLVLAGIQAYELSAMETTHGVAIKYQQGMHGSGPHVRYSVDDNEYVTSANSYHGEGVSSGVRVGDDVLIYYWKSEPANAKVGLPFELWFAPVFVTGVGLGFIVLASVLTWTQKT